MKNKGMIGWLMLPLCIILLGTGCKSPQKGRIDLLVVTGGHAYDTSEFIEMFESFPGVSFELVLKPDAWKKLAAGREFDVIVFYDMWTEPLTAEEKEIFLGEFDKGTGMVFLHHSLASHPEWPEYTQLIGGKYNLPERTADTSLWSDFKHDIALSVSVVDHNHPVTQGVDDYEIIDEGYSHITVLPGVHYLLETSHPDCDRHIGWTHQVKNSKVVYLMGGHDKQAYENLSFRKLVLNAIQYTRA